MHALSSRIRTLLKDCSYDERQKAEFAALCLATSIAQRLTLPSTAVASVDDYFMNNHRAVVIDLVDRFNRHFPINIMATVALVKDMFTTRYRLVYDPRAEFELLMLKFSDPRTPTINELSKAFIRRNDTVPAFRELVSSVLWTFQNSLEEGALAE